MASECPLPTTPVGPAVLCLGLELVAPMGPGEALGSAAPTMGSQGPECPHQMSRASAAWGQRQTAGSWERAWGLQSDG